MKPENKKEGTIRNKIYLRLKLEKHLKLIFITIATASLIIYVGYEYKVKFDNTEKYNVIVKIGNDKEFQQKIHETDIITMLDNIEASYDKNDIYYVDYKNVKFEELSNYSTSDIARIEIIIVDISTSTEEIAITYSEKVEYDSSLEYGKETIKTSGRNGLKSITTTSIYRNNILYDNSKVESIITEPITQIKVVGTKPHNGGNNNFPSSGNNSASGSSKPPVGDSSSGGNNESKPPSSCTITINGVVHPC